MKIREGAYYRTRGGDVVGPMTQSKVTLDGWESNCFTWPEDGRFLRSGAQHTLDLISEVYVSDTPPAVKETEAELRAKLLAAGPGPFIEVHDRKTLRDEFAMEAMKLLIPRHERREETLAEFSYRQADAMMEARKK